MYPVCKVYLKKEQCFVEKWKHENHARNIISIMYNTVLKIPYFQHLLQLVDMWITLKIVDKSTSQNVYILRQNSSYFFGVHFH